MDAPFKKEIIITSSVIGGSLILFMIAFLAIAGRIDTAVASIKLARTTIQTQSQAVSALAKLKQDVGQADQYQEQINLLLPKKEELLGASRAIDAIARAHNVTFHFSFQSTTAPASLGVPGYIGFNLDADGTYENVRDFWSDLESKTSRFVMQFGDLSLASSPSGYKMSGAGKLFFR
jgi:Tfp pilus assembly protein PilO